MPNTKPNLYVFATYWNENEWIDVSLKQLKLFKARKIIISEGCFDPQKPIRSTDDTCKKLKEFEAINENVKLISVIRKSKLRHILDWLLLSSHHKFGLIAKLVYLPWILKSSIYRLNQMSTFQHMLSEISGIQKNDWFMTYDADQFYSDEIINKLMHLDEYKDFELLTTKELTFFNTFNTYNDHYEQRDYNNMPHKFNLGIRFIPTRNPSRIQKFRYKTISNITSNKKYIGKSFHYKIKNEERLFVGYSLGDRKAPSNLRTETKEYTGKHPSIIENFFYKT